MPGVGSWVKDWDATRCGFDWMFIANHLLATGGQGAVQMVHQCEQRSNADAGQRYRRISFFRRRLGKVGHRASNRTAAPVRQPDNDERRTARRMGRNKLQTLTRKSVSRVNDCQMRHNPIENGGSL